MSLPAVTAEALAVTSRSGGEWQVTFSGSTAEHTFLVTTLPSPVLKCKGGGGTLEGTPQMELSKLLMNFEPSKLPSPRAAATNYRVGGSRGGFWAVVGRPTGGQLIH